MLVRSDAGDGGWSLHAPGSTDDEIASGDAPPLVSGPSDTDRDGEWERPDGADYADAMFKLSGGGFAGGYLR